MKLLTTIENCNLFAHKNLQNMPIGPFARANMSAATLPLAYLYFIELQCFTFTSADNSYDIYKDVFPQHLYFGRRELSRSCQFPGGHMYWVWVKVCICIVYLICCMVGKLRYMEWAWNSV